MPREVYSRRGRIRATQSVGPEVRGLSRWHTTSRAEDCCSSKPAQGTDANFHVVPLACSRMIRGATVQGQCFRNAPYPWNIAIMLSEMKAYEDTCQMCILSKLRQGGGGREDETRFPKAYKREANGTRRLFEMWIVADAKGTKPMIPARRGIVAIAADTLGVHCRIHQPHCNVMATIRPP